MSPPPVDRLRARLRAARQAIAQVQEWRRVRFHTAWTSCAAILFATGVAADNIYLLLGDWRLEVDDGWGGVVVSIMFFCGAFGILVNNALARLFFRLGLEAEYHPMRAYYPDTDVEVSLRARLFVTYPMLILLAVVGLCLWVNMLSHLEA